MFYLDSLTITKSDDYLYQLLIESQREIMLRAAYELDQENLKTEDIDSTVQDQIIKSKIVQQIY